MKYREFLEITKNNSHCCSAESLNQRFAKYLRHKAVEGKEEKAVKEAEKSGKTLKSTNAEFI